MRWRAETFAEEQARKGQWRRWFALWPVVLWPTTEWRWLCFVERSVVWVSGTRYDCGGWESRYRDPIQEATK